MGFVAYSCWTSSSGVGGNGRSMSPGERVEGSVERVKGPGEGVKGLSWTFDDAGTEKCLMARVSIISATSIR